jgi:hypothetical protein
MTITATGGVSSVSVTSGAEVDLLATGASASQGLAIPRAFSWTLTVGLAILSAITSTATSAAPLVIQQSEYPAQRIRVTAQAASATATVSADFIAQSSTVN